MCPLDAIDATVHGSTARPLDAIDATFSSAMAYTGRDSKISNVIWSPFATSRATRSASWNPSSTSGSSAGAPLRRGP